MQYLLDQNEMSMLQKRAMHGDRSPSTEDLQKLCSLAADHAPCDRDWDQNDKSPWGCILTKGDTGYCDDCPVINLCPHPNKQWSK